MSAPNLTAKQRAAEVMVANNGRPCRLCELDIEEAITAAVAAETARCLAIVRSEPEYPDADKTEHAHVIALIREHPITAAQAIAADVKEAIARRIEFQGEK